MVVNFSVQYLRVVQGGVEYSETLEVFIASVIHLAVWVIMWIMVQQRVEPNAISTKMESPFHLKCWNKPLYYVK
jgi:hypothetical protein